MKIIQLITLTLFVFINVEAELDTIFEESSSDESNQLKKCKSSRYKHPPFQFNNVQLKIISGDDDDGESLLVNLERTERFLANEHLPVWILEGVVDMDFEYNNNGDELKRDYEVMEQLGGFTIYQDPETSAAAVYFHKRREFDGVINYELLIQKLSIDKIGTIHVVGKDGMNRRPEYQGHEKASGKYNEDIDADVDEKKISKTYQGRLFNGYPEVLVIISWDLAQHLTKSVRKSEWYPTIVSHVLTLFNGVDMLYSKLHETRIQINIAGIIIGTRKESFPFLKHCYYVGTNLKSRSSENMVEGLCFNKMFRKYLSARTNIFPIDSYDIAIVLTRHDLIHLPNDITTSNDVGTEEYRLIAGVSNTLKNIYEYKKADVESILVGTVADDANLKYYAVLAHEIAHMMTVLHDMNSVFTDDGNCCGKLMKQDGSYWCRKCLSWSKFSEETFKLFFSSPNCCIFINEPRSLRSPGCHKLLTADQQCQCYGYESALREICPAGNNRFCESKLQCKKRRNIFEDTVIPMDGTPCRKNKVCWGRRCQ